MLFTVRSRRRAASAKSSDGSGATSKPRCPGPRLLSRRGSEKSTSMPADPEHTERAPDRVHLAEARKQGFERFCAEAEHLDIEVLRTRPKEVVAHPAAYHYGPAAGIADSLRDLDAPWIES